MSTINREIQNVLPLTQIQRELLFSYLTAPAKHLYYEQQTYLLTGNIQEELVQKAWTHLVHEHELLRCVIVWEDFDDPKLIVYQHKRFPCQILDYSKKEHPTQYINQLINDQWNQPLNLNKNAFRLTLCKLSQEKYLMIYNTHHLFVDGWSNMILLNDFYDTYHRLFFNMPLPQKKKISLEKGIKFSNRQTSCDTTAFWKNYLKGHHINRNVPVQIASKAKNSFSNYPLQKCTVKKIKQLAQRLQVTLGSLFYSGWGILQLQRKKASEALVGITLSGRDSSLFGITDLVGVFIKTLPLRIQLFSNDTVLQFVRRTHIDIINIVANQQIRLAEIKAIIGCRNLQLFDSVLVMQKYRIFSDEFEKQKKIINLELYNNKYNSNIDLMVNVKDLPNDYMEIEFNYNTQKYSDVYIDELYESFISIIQLWIQADDLNNLKIEFPKGVEL